MAHGELAGEGGDGLVGNLLGNYMVVELVAA